MAKQLAFVLSGGGSHGAMQAGALRALIEAGYLPDFVTGTSIGAANGAFLAVHGYHQPGVEQLYRVWGRAAHEELLPTNLWWQMMRSFFGRSGMPSQQRVREFAIQNGLKPGLRFRDLSIRFYAVASDLNAGCPVVFGLDPDESLLEGVLASMTLPPWMSPVERKGRYLLDGGMVSNLPVQVAMDQGATEIIALDLTNPHEVGPEERGLRPFFLKLNQTVEARQVELELRLAEARGIRVRHISLVKEGLPPMWDFRQSLNLIEYGYGLAKQAIEGWRSEERPFWWRQLRRLPGFEGFMLRRG